MGTLVAVLAAIIGGVIWVVRLDNRQTNVEAAMARQEKALVAVGESIKELRREVESSVKGIRNEMEIGKDGYVSREFFSIYLDLLRARNPSVDVPQLPSGYR